MIKSSNTRYQYLGALCCNLLTVAFGGCFGWTSVNFILLQSNETPLESGPLTLGEASLVVALLTFGCFWGNILFGYISEHFGRKWPLFWMAVPETLGWIMILTASHVYHLYIARFLLGIAAGAYFVLIPLYVTEISDDRNRGSLNSLIELACNVGVLLELIASSYLSYAAQAWIFLTIPIIFMTVFFFFPETPDYLMRKQKKLEAEKSLNFYRNLNKIHPEIPKYELENKLSVISKPKVEVDEVKKPDKVTFKDFCTPVARKAIIIGFGLMVLNQFTGCIVMLSYLASIFTESGSTMTANQSAIVIGVIQCIGSYVSTILIDRAGRKLLLTISAIGNGLGIFCLGAYDLMKQMEYDLEDFKWIPLASFSFAVFISNVGILSVHYCIIVEVLPQKIKNYGCSLCLSLMWIFEFAISGLYPIISLSIGMHAAMFIFSVISVCGAFFVILYIPETKGRSHEEIMDLMANRKKVISDK